MIVYDPVTGEYKVKMSHDEFMDAYHRWQQKPETRAMCAKMAAERRETINKILADIEGRKK